MNHKRRQTDFVAKVDEEKRSPKDWLDFTANLVQFLQYVFSHFALNFFTEIVLFVYGDAFSTYSFGRSQLGDTPWSSYVQVVPLERLCKWQTSKLIGRSM
jgi:hypothetical protein